MCMKTISNIQQFAHKLSLLYVERDDILQNRLGRYFKDLFSHVYQARSIDSALELFKQNKPDIVVTDLSFTDNINASGFEFVMQLQEIDSSSQIIVLSIKNDDFRLLQSFDVGVVKLLQKPFEFTKLNQALDLAIVNIMSNSKDTLSSEILLKTIQDKSTIECINNYRGLYLHNTGELISFTQNRLTIKVNKTQLIAALFEKQMILQIDKDRILAKLVSVNREKSLVVLSTPISLTNEQRDPVNKRIDVDNRFKTSIGIKSRHYEVDPLNLSFNYLAVKTHEFLPIQINDTIELTLGFEIDAPSSFLQEKQFTKAFATGQIQRVENFGNFLKLNIKLDIKTSGQRVFKKYLQQRELEIINEFKTRLKK